jgi:hypothetical protein
MTKKLIALIFFSVHLVFANQNPIYKNMLKVKAGECGVLASLFEKQCLGMAVDPNYSDYSNYISKNMEQIKNAYPSKEASNCRDIGLEVEKTCKSNQMEGEDSYWIVESPKTKTPEADTGKETFVPPVYLLGTPKKKKK